LSWRKISLKFPGKCIVCNEKIEQDEIAFWAKDIGIKHEKCASIEPKKQDQINSEYPTKKISDLKRKF